MTSCSKLEQFWGGSHILEGKWGYVSKYIGGDYLPLLQCDEIHQATMSLSTICCFGALNNSLAMAT